MGYYKPCRPIRGISLITLEPITPQNALVFKAVRLRALKEDPHAFGSTYAQEAQFPGSEWLARAGRMNGEIGIGFLAMDSDNPCGIVGAFLDQHDPRKAHLISMWTAPMHRQQGIGRMLVDAVLKWARERSVCTLHLMVTSNNASAIRFYKQLGFIRTGRTVPYPNDPAVIEYEMSRALG